MAAPGFSVVSNPNPAEYAAAVTTSDSTNFDNLTRGIYIGGAGNVSVYLDDGTTVLFKGAVAGSIIPVRAKRINSTATTATDIVALY